MAMARQNSAKHLANIAAATAFTAIRWCEDERVLNWVGAAADLAARNWFIGNPQGHGEERSSIQIPFPVYGTPFTWGVSAMKSKLLQKRVAGAP